MGGGGGRAGAAAGGGGGGGGAEGRGRFFIKEELNELNWGNAWI